METKHLTIMFTDIKEFTVKASKSSREQLQKFLALQDRLIVPVFKEFGGKVVKTIGDSFMVTFHSPTDAVLCGMKIQNVLAKHNAKAPEDEHLKVRIAINSGEVTVKDNDVFGEAVNIASRLENIAETGDIYFTESVYLTMNKSEIPTAEVGYRHFKGIPEEIKVYKVLREGKRKKGLPKLGKRPVAEYVPEKKDYSQVLKWVLIILIPLLIIALIAGIVLRRQKAKTLPEKPLLEKEIRKEEIKKELESVIIDTRQAIKGGDKAKAERGIEKLIRASEELGNPPELEKEILDLKRLYKENFK